ncbi:hypothetical protein [Streptomyces amakusaensis]|uniref:Uncharacterized protein n=1 Tax=Streptomyces amakusaensis TaxID=67271 RepID=A0ABW0ANA6_9ACTN
MNPVKLDTDPAAAVSALAHAELQAVEQPLPEDRASALGRLSRISEAETEARRGYRTG